MTDTRKAQLEIGVNAGPAEEGFKRVERAASGMGEKLSQSAKRAGEAVDGIGASAERSAAQQERAYGRFEALIRRQTAAQQALVEGTGRTGEIVNRLISQGLDPARFEGQLAALRALEKAQGSLGISAKQTAAAMRGVPAQFTDIITSLQGGQAPLTVLLQQGGQLKDMFGGVSNAAKSLGGYVLGLVNPFTVAAAAVGTLGLAYYQGRKEADAYNKALLLSGNAVGTTVGQLNSMAASMSKLGVTQGAAAEALAVFAQTSGAGKANLEEFALSALKFSKVTGQSLSEVSKQFGDLAKDPLGASLKLNESMNYLTGSIYQQIKALQEQGKATEATAVAQKALADAGVGIEKNYTQGLGALERSWNAVTKAITGAWSAAKNVGRVVGPEAQLATVQATLADREQSLKEYGNRGGVFGKTTAEQIKDLREQESVLQSTVREIQKGVTLRAEEAVQVKARAEADKDALKYLTDEQKIQRDIAQQVGALRAAKASELEIETRIAQIRASYDKKTPAATGGQSELADLRAKTIEAERYLQALKEQGLKADKLTEGERAALRLREELKGTLTAQVRASKEASLAEAERLGTVQRLIVAEKDQAETAKFFEDSIKAQSAAVNATDKTIESLKKQAVAEREATASIGLSKEAIAELTTAKYDDSAASKERLANIMAEAGEPDLLIKKYREEAQALRDLALARRGRGSAETTQDDAKKAIDDAKKSLQEFDTLMGNIDLSKMNGMFNGAVDGAIKFATALNTVATVAEKTEAALAANAKVNAGDGAKRAAEEVRILAQSATAQISAYGNMAAGLKSYAKEGSKAYNALYTAEKVYRAFELASAVSNMATKSGLLTAFVGTKVAGDQLMAQSATTSAGTEAAAALTAGQAKAVSAVAGQGAGDPYTAFPRIAAMAAIMAALGFATGAIGGGGSGAAPTNSGKGTVFGDSSATSESLSNSLDLLNDTQDIALTYSKAMAASLRSIEANLGGFTNIYLRSGGTSALTNTIATGKFDTGLSSVLSFGKEILGPLGNAFGSLITSLFGKKVSITGSGISANDQTLGAILGSGFQGNTFADVNTKKKFFGITYSDKTNTQLGDLDPALARQITAIFSGVGSAIGLAADLLGQDTLDTQKKLQDYVISIGRIDLKDLKGKEIAEKLGAVFGAESDKIAASVIPGFERLQAVGEGYFETLTRVANEFETVNAYMARLSDTLGQVGIDAAVAADDLVQAFGGLDAFQSAISDYYNTFYTEAERNAQTTKELGTAFAGLGKSMPTTLTGFRDLVNAQDLTTQAGRSTYAALISLAPAFAEVTNAADDAAQAIVDAAKAVSDQRDNLQQQLDQAQGNTAAIRARELAALDPSNRALQQRIYLLADEEAAMQASVRNTDAALAAVRKAVDAEKTLQQVRVTAAQEQVNTIKGVFDTLDSAISSLLGNVATSAADGENFITQALSAARTTGYLPDHKDLSNAITAATGGLASKVYASAADQEADRLRLAAKLTDLKGVAGDQLTTAELTLKNSQDQLTSLENIYTQAQQQVNILRGIDTTAKTIPEALSLLGTTLTAELRAVASAAAAGSASAAAAAARQPYSVNDTPAQRQSKVEAQTGVALSASDTALVAAAKVLYQSINGGASTAAYNAAAAAVGGDIARAVGWDGSREGAENLRKVYGFASGGTHTGGLRLVGENGPELEVTGPSRIYSADQTRAMLQGGNTQALVAEIQALTKEVQRLQAITQDGTREARRTAEATNGNPEQPMLVQTV
jgi:phage-related minor tail protein